MVQIYLQTCNLYKEWDSDIASTIARFANEEDLIIPILQLFSHCVEKEKERGTEELNEEDAAVLSSIIEELTTIAEEALHSSKYEISDAAQTFLTLIDQI